MARTRTISANQPSLIERLIPLVLFGLMLLAFLSQVLRKDGDKIGLQVPELTGVSLLFSLLIIGAAVWVVFIFISKRKTIERKDVVIMVIAIAILWFVFNALNPDGLRLMSVQLMSSVGI